MIRSKLRRRIEELVRENQITMEAVVSLRDKVNEQRIVISRMSKNVKPPKRLFKDGDKAEYFGSRFGLFNINREWEVLTAEFDAKTFEWKYVCKRDALLQVFIESDLSVRCGQC